MYSPLNSIVYFMDIENFRIGKAKVIKVSEDETAELRRIVVMNTGEEADCTKYDLYDTFEECQKYLIKNTKQLADIAIAKETEKLVCKITHIKNQAPF